MSEDLPHKKSFLEIDSLPELLDALPRGKIAGAAFVLLTVLCALPALRLLYGAITGHAGLTDLQARGNEFWSMAQQVCGLLGLEIGLVCMGKSILAGRRKGEKLGHWLHAHLVALLLLALLLWSVVCTITSIDPMISFLGDAYRKDGLLAYFAYYGWFCLTLSVKRPQREKLLGLAALLALPVAATTLLDKTALRDWLCLTQAPYAAPFENTNHTGYYLCVAMAAAAGKLLLSKKLSARVLWGTVEAILGLALLVNGSMGPYLAVLVGLVFPMVLCLFHKNRLWKQALCTLLVFGAITGVYAARNVRFVQDTQKLGQDIQTLTQTQADEAEKDRAGSGRWVLWRLAAEFTAERPIFGYGPDTFSELYAEKGVSATRPHCTPLQIAASLGIPGLLLYLAALGWFLISVLRVKRPTPLLLVLLCIGTTYFVSSLVGNSMYYTTPYFCMIWGLAQGTQWEETNPKEIHS